MLMYPLELLNKFIAILVNKVFVLLDYSALVYVVRQDIVKFYISSFLLNTLLLIRGNYIVIKVFRSIVYYFFPKLCSR